MGIPVGYRDACFGQEGGICRDTLSAESCSPEFVMNRFTVSVATLLLSSSCVMAQIPYSDEDFARAYADSMCQSYQVMVRDLSGLSGQNTVPKGVVRETFKEFPDLELRNLLTKTVDLIIQSPSRGDRYLKGGQFLSDCQDVALRAYERANSQAPGRNPSVPSFEAAAPLRDSAAKSDQSPASSLRQRR